MAFGLKETLIAIPVMMGLVSPTMAEDFVLRFGPNTVRIGPNGISVQAPQWALQFRRSQGQDYPVYQARSLATHRHLLLLRRLNQTHSGRHHLWLACRRRTAEITTTCGCCTAASST